MGRPRDPMYPVMMDNLERLVRSWESRYNLIPRPRDVLKEWRAQGKDHTKMQAHYWLRQLHESGRIDDVLARCPMAPRSRRKLESVTNPQPVAKRVQDNRHTGRCTPEMARKIMDLLLEIA